MRKLKKFALSLVAVAACAGAFGTYEIYQQSGESDALLAENIEALSGGEWDSVCHHNNVSGKWLCKWWLEGPVCTCK